MVEITIEKDPLLGTIDTFTVGGVDADLEDFGMIEVSGDCSSGVCQIVRRFIKFDETPKVLYKYAIDRNGYEEVCDRLCNETFF